MLGFLTALVGTAALSIGGRAQMLVGRLSDGLARTGSGRLERPALLFITAVPCTIASTAFMAWLGAMAADLSNQRAQLPLVMVVLILAAVELLWPVRSKAMREPTRSLVAIAAVLLVRQVTDAARLLIFAFALVQGDFANPFIAGVIGGTLAVGAGWWFGAGTLAELPMRAVRGSLAFATIIAATVIYTNNSFAHL